MYGRLYTIFILIGFHQIWTLLTWRYRTTVKARLRELIITYMVIIPYINVNCEMVVNNKMMAKIQGTYYPLIVLYYFILLSRSKTFFLSLPYHFTVFPVKKKNNKVSNIKNFSWLLYTFFFLLYIKNVKFIKDELFRYFHN